MGSKQSKGNSTSQPVQAPPKSQPVVSPPKEQKPEEKKPQDPILTYYRKLCGTEEIMNDEILFTFLGEELGIADDDIVSGYIATTIMQIKKIDKVPFESFKRLFTYSNTTTVQGIKNNLSSFRSSCKEMGKFREMYENLFDLYTGKHKTIQLETASQLWFVYLRDKLKWMKQLQQYIESREDKETLRIHKDLWKMMLSFSLQVHSLESDYKEDDFWPTFIENFVDYLKTNK